MSLLRTLVLSVGVAGLLTGCFKINYHTGQPAEPMPTYNEWHHLAVLGLVEISDPIALNQVCPSGFAEVHNEVSLVNGLVPIGISMCTGLGWLYNPHTVTVKCVGGKAYRLQMNDEGMVAAAEFLGEE